MGFKSDNNEQIISEINVTPFVDVMLVLLVIFMITAPLMLNGIDLQLPKTKEVNRINLKAKQVILSVSRAGEFFIGNNKILPGEIILEIKSQFELTKTKTLYLRADYGIKYGKVARIISHLKQAGITEIALVTETEEDS